MYSVVFERIYGKIKVNESAKRTDTPYSALNLKTMSHSQYEYYVHTFRKVAKIKYGSVKEIKIERFSKHRESCHKHLLSDCRTII